MLTSIRELTSFFCVVVSGGLINYDCLFSRRGRRFISQIFLMYDFKRIKHFRREKCFIYYN